MAELDVIYERYRRDPSVLDALLESLRKYALVLAYRNRHPSMEDAASVIVERVWRSLSRFDGRSSFRSWVRSLAINYLRDEARARKRSPIPEQMPVAYEPVSGDASVPVRDYNALPHTVRVIAQMLAEGFSVAEIARSLCYAERTLRRIIADHITSSQAA